MALPFDGNDAAVVVDLAAASPRASQRRTPPHSVLMSNMHDHSGRSRATLRTVSSLQSMASHASSSGGVNSHRSHKAGNHRRGSDGSMKIRQREPMVRTDPWHARSRRGGSEPPSDVAVRLRHADASPVARRSPTLGAADPDTNGDGRGNESGVGGSGMNHTSAAAPTVSVVVRERVLRQSSSVDSRPGIGDLPLYRSHRPTRVDVGEYSPLASVPVSASDAKLVFSSSAGGGDSARSLAAPQAASNGVSAYVSTQQPYASVISSNSTCSMATTPSAAHAAATSPRTASNEWPPCMRRLVATAALVLLSVVAGVWIQAEHISDGCTSDFAVAAVAVPALFLVVAAAAALLFRRAAAQPDPSPVAKRACVPLPADTLAVSPRAISGIDFVLYQMSRVQDAAMTAGAAEVVAALSKAKEVLRAPDLFSLRHSATLELIQASGVEGASGWLNHNMVMPEHSSSAMTPSMRRRVRMSVVDGLSDRAWQSSRGLAGKGDSHGHLATVPDTLPSPVPLAAAPENALGSDTRTVSGSSSSAPAERKGVHSSMSQGSNRQRTASSFSVDPHEMVPLEVHLLEVGNLNDTLLRNKDDFNVDMFEVATATQRPLVAVMVVALEELGSVAELGLTLQCVLEFVSRIGDGYGCTNPYHNSIHAADVTWDMQYLIRNTKLSTVATPLQKFSALIAAAVHDYMHPALSNNFLVETSHPIAIVHNDSSVLERFHVSEAFGVAFEMNESNPFMDLAGSDFVDLRRIIIGMVLGTDPTTHLEFLGRVRNMRLREQLAEAGADTGAGAEQSPAVRGIVEDMLKGALMLGDIGHAAKSFLVHAKWSTRLQEEFFSQGDKEADFGITISPLCDRNTSETLSESQIGFFTFVATPLYRTLAKHMFGRGGVMADLRSQMKVNVNRWKLRRGTVITQRSASVGSAGTSDNDDGGLTPQHRARSASHTTPRAGPPAPLSIRASSDTEQKPGTFRRHRRRLSVADVVLDEDSGESEDDGEEGNPNGHAHGHTNGSGAGNEE